MRRLHLQIFLSLLLVVVLFAFLVATAWWIRDDDHDFERQAIAGMQALIAEALPPKDAPLSELEAKLERFGTQTDTRITIRNRQGELLAAHGSPISGPDWTGDRTAWADGRRKTAGLRLADGRQVLVQPKMEDDDDHLHGFGFVAIILSFVAALGIGAYPMARRLTSRLERLQQRVDALGSGDLNARVDIEGRDEVAALAQSFNDAADRIQDLVEAQKQTLAAASHELRTPLARIRMAFELLEQPNADDAVRQDLRRRVERDIADLDELIEELLLVSRLDRAPATNATGEIDLLGLAAEEAARIDATASGAPCEIRGDKRLIRRAIRNLLENANHHGGGEGVEIVVKPTPHGATLLVSDQGPGVPEAKRERVFEPFFHADPSEDGGGVGLGLYLVRQIARAHGGDAVCLASDRGALFEITLVTPGKAG